jgi:hypothetical protein
MPPAERPEVDMTHDPHTLKPYDPSRINALDPAEMRYWCIDLGCTRRQLLDAISTVGDHVAAIREFLKSGGAAAGDNSARQ